VKHVLDIDRWWEPLRRQVQTSSIIVGVCAVVVGSIGFLWPSAAFAVSMFIQDVLGVMIFLSLATALLSWLT
jgi:hypothetical protein